MFSRRTVWESSANRLTEILEARRASGLRVVDLTLSNPTLCGFKYPEERILKALSSPESLKYRPDPHGLMSAREAISAYYASCGVEVSPEDLFITASTSESYSLLFRLLCNPGDTVVIPTPSYPLFDYLAGINDVKTEYYRLVRGERWRLDAGSLRKAMSRTVKAVLAVDPHNPTGMFLSQDEMREIAAIASGHGAALIVDEVFREYRFDGPAATDRAPAAETHPGLTFLLNGLSKMSALPQVKIGWIALRGDNKLRSAARSRLEILNDVYLSAGTPAQAAVQELIVAGAEVRPQIMERVKGNYAALRNALDGIAGCRVLPCEGGWNAVVQLPGGLGDEECAVGLLDEAGVYCYPGFFFDFEEDDVLVVSLLQRAEEFLEGVVKIAGWIAPPGGESERVAGG
jgi:aspartate/methionine/tyrosine aminotransferase